MWQMMSGESHCTHEVASDVWREEGRGERKRKKRREEEEEEEEQEEDEEEEEEEGRSDKI